MLLSSGGPLEGREKVAEDADGGLELGVGQVGSRAKP
jgi:hypothetical protein